MGSIALVDTRIIAGHGSASTIPRNRARPHGTERRYMLDPSICWQAIYSRDPRFDGRFFAGATTTGLYCRNVCPVPFAKPKNILLFACAAAAEAAGFRPCKRCQPQAAPGTPAWLGTSAVVNRAFRLILEGALNEGTVEGLAGRLGLGSRQLRRLFVQHLGASPLKIATTHRVHLARKLIDESRLPMTQIAFCSGFKSIREFNHALRSSTGQSPSELRRATYRPTTPVRRGGLELRLPYRRPYDWANLIAFLQHRAIPGVEVVTGSSYQRTIEVAGVPGFLTVSPDDAGSRLIVHLETSSYQGLAQTVERIRRIFDLGADPVQIASHLSRDPMLRRLLQLRPGLRVPGVWDGFEAAVLAVFGQKLTTRGPNRSVKRLIQTFGTPVDTPVVGLRYAFPRPEVLAVADLGKAGISDACANILRKLAGSIIRNQLTFETSTTLEQAVAQVGAVCGIDESTANYIAMRAFGEPDALPSRELGLRRGLKGVATILTPAQFIDRADQWRPWRAYAAMHIAQSAERHKDGHHRCRGSF
jgi:AraC family transcriptional regulator, regulatory protein of adaptative response / DNA-3-methyladenine glycosylase II